MTEPDARPIHAQETSDEQVAGDGKLVSFDRTVWSTSDSVDEANQCVLWEGPAAELATFKVELHLDVEALGGMQVTPYVLVSNDGEAWSEADWVGTPPSPVTSNDVQMIGPCGIDVGHGKRLVRVCLRTEKDSGTGVVYGRVQGRLWLSDLSLDYGKPAYLASDVTRNNTTTVTDVPGMSRPLAANAYYRWRAHLFFSSPSNADFKVAYTVPSGATDYWTDDASGTGANYGGGSEKVHGSNGAIQSAVHQGVVMTGATAGDLQLQIAQGTAQADTTSLKKGSYIEAERMDL